MKDSLTCKGEILGLQSKENEVNKNNKPASESLHLTNHQVRQRAMVVRLGEYVLKPAVVSYYESSTKRRKVQLIYYGWLDIPSEISMIR